MSRQDTELTAIPKIRHVIYTTYALFPASGLSVEDLAYATDLRCLFRWNGASWDSLTVYSLADLFASRPVAATLPNGSLFYATDTGVLYIKQGAAWVNIAASQLTVNTVNAYNAAAPTTWTDLDLSAIVGANLALVIIKIHNTVSQYTYAFRKNGDADEYYVINAPTGGLSITDTNNVHSLVMVPTDAGGIIEWRGENAAAIALDVIAFLR